MAGSSPSLPDGSNPSAAIVQSASDVQCSRLLKTTSGIKTYLLITVESGKICPFWTNNYREALMSEHRPIYGANTAVLSDFPEPVRATLHLIEKNPSNEAALILLQCAASAAHPDYLFSLAMLSALPIEYKEAALELIEHSLTSGFTVDEQSALLRFVEPFMATALRAPRGR